MRRIGVTSELQLLCRVRGRPEVSPSPTAFKALLLVIQGVKASQVGLESGLSQRQLDGIVLVIMCLCGVWRADDGVDD